MFESAADVSVALETITVLVVLLMNTAVVIKSPSVFGPDVGLLLSYCTVKAVEPCRQFKNVTVAAPVRSHATPVHAGQYDLLSWTDWSSGWLNDFQCYSLHTRCQFYNNYRIIAGKVVGCNSVNKCYNLDTRAAAPILAS